MQFDENWNIEAEGFFKYKVRKGERRTEPEHLYYEVSDIFEKEK